MTDRGAPPGVPLFASESRWNSLRARAAAPRGWRREPMSEPASLSGPDLEAGVPATSLQEGVPLLGHAHGQAVIVVKRGAAVCAIGATCSHYGGPLAEGLVVGDTVRCPWHHACFDLATGEAVGAPALEDVPAFEVVERDGAIHVGAARPRSRRRLTGPGPASVVVVGAGAAGAAAVEMLRREGYGGPI